MGGGDWPKSPFWVFLCCWGGCTRISGKLPSTLSSRSKPVEFPKAALRYRLAWAMQAGLPVHARSPSSLFEQVGRGNGERSGLEDRPMTAQREI